jgi:hypothetical protein
MYYFFANNLVNFAPALKLLASPKQLHEGTVSASVAVYFFTIKKTRSAQKF